MYCFLLLPPQLDYDDEVLFLDINSTRTLKRVSLCNTLHNAVPRTILANPISTNGGALIPIYSFIMLYMCAGCSVFQLKIMNKQHRFIYIVESSTKDVLTLDERVYNGAPSVQALLIMRNCIICSPLRCKVSSQNPTSP